MNTIRHLSESDSCMSVETGLLRQNLLAISSAMTESDQLDELMECRIDQGRKVAEPCTVVIFGASGDLTARKLIPALYHLFLGKQLPKPVRIIGFARREKTDEQLRA